MTSSELNLLKYPIGKFVKPEPISESQILEWIKTIEELPKHLSELTKNLSIEQLNFLYRPEGWSIKQVVHHLADSHINSLIRFKLTLTEDDPTIKPYHEDRWATLADGMDDNIIDSLTLLKSLHNKWTKLLLSLTPEDLKRVYIHPEHDKQFSLQVAIGLYAWHSNHHLAHIEQGLKYNGKF